MEQFEKQKGISNTKGIKQNVEVLNEKSASPKQEEYTSQELQKNTINYFEKYHLDPNATRKENLLNLRKQQGEINQKQSAGALNEKILKILKEQDKQIAEAIKIFKNDENYKQYKTTINNENNNIITIKQTVKSALLHSETSRALVEETKKVFKPTEQNLNKKGLQERNDN